MMSLEKLNSLLAEEDTKLSTYDFDPALRQPIHTVYIPAQFISENSPREWGDQALAALKHVPRHSTSLSHEDFAELMPAVRAKLESEPIEDLRIDLEDGFNDVDEDAKAKQAAQLVSRWLRAGDVPFCGIRIKSFSPETRERSLRTLEIVLDHLDVPALDSSHGRDLHDPTQRAFRLTFPKVTSPKQVEAFASMHDLPFEIQFETPQAVLRAEEIMEAAAGRCLAFHYGTYDYSASMGIDARHQSMEHPVADFAKNILQLVTAESSVELSDGSTNFIPFGEDRDAAWANHFRLVRRQLSRGIRQGWDLHPTQLPTRYLATYSYFREYSVEATQRLLAYLGHDQSQWMDEPATVKALASYLARAAACGAVESPLPIEELQNLAKFGYKAQG